MAIVFGFAGVRIKLDQLSLSPKLPSDWEHYQFKLQYKGRSIQVKVDREEVELLLLSGEELMIKVREEEITLKPLAEYKLPN